MKIDLKLGYILVSNQEISEKQEAGKIITSTSCFSHQYLRIESDSESFKTGQGAYMLPHKPKVQAGKNLFIIAEADIVATFIVEE